MLGIGDRHTQNVLVQQHTAEIVHIDFGIIFEQGKLLPTPEAVPFRLTRDVVDGMGPAGTAGTFARSCASTMRVCRANAATVQTIVGVVLSDPLFRWQLTPAQRQGKQQGGRNRRE